MVCTALTLEMGCSDTQFSPPQDIFTFLQSLFYFLLSCTALGGGGKEIKVIFFLMLPTIITEIKKHCCIDQPKKAIAKRKCMVVRN